jgi:hypothetical protein
MVAEGLENNTWVHDITGALTVLVLVGSSMLISQTRFNGARRLQVNILLPRPMLLYSLARPKLLGHARSGKHARRMPITFSYGWPFLTDVGRQSDDTTMAYRTVTNTQYALKPRKP